MLRTARNLARLAPAARRALQRGASSQSSVAAKRAHYEGWMINLRGESWLDGPRKADWYTGKHPRECPGMGSDGCLRSLPTANLASVTRESAQAAFDNSWTTYEMLFAGLNGEDPFYRPPPHGLRHPQVFYYGHSASLYVNKLLVAGLIDKPINPYYEDIFETGVDEMSWDDMHKNDMVWPTVEQTRSYRAEVYDLVCDLIANHPAFEGEGGAPVQVGWDHPLWALFMGIEHERIHLETSSVLFREMDSNMMQTPEHWPELHPSVARTHPSTDPVEGDHYPSNELVQVDGGSVVLGKPREFPTYGWDNEYGERAVEVAPFSASKFMVSNGEYWKFVSSGGYRNERYWSPEGWRWRKFRNAKWPFFWELDGPQGSFRFKLRTIFESATMQWDWPVDVNYHEARAFCAWRSEQDGLCDANAYRVVTEAEHNVLRGESYQKARSDTKADRITWASGHEFANPELGQNAANLNLSYSSQSPVGSLPPSSTGHYDVMGNSWEWTEDHFNPLKGFQIHSVYEDFSTPCFDGKHNVIQGGSFMSTGIEASTFARFHFRPHFLQHIGFRVVSSNNEAPAYHLDPIEDAEVTEHENVYETAELCNQYLGLHYGQSPSSEFPPILDHANAPEYALQFPQRVARLLVELAPEAKNGRALDVGCAVGGGSFELARTFDEVVAFDFSEAFVDLAKQVQQGREVTYEVPVEAELSAKARVALPTDIDEAVRARVNFRVGDACAMSDDAKELGQFDGVVMANLICRLPEPLRCLDGLQSVVKPGGVVVMATPFSWLEQYTAKCHWLGGFKDGDGVERKSKDTLKTEMEARGFEKIHEEQMPCLIREHQRKYQYIISEATAWRKTK